MGEVYQATDSRLGRSVAIKFLPEAFTDDPERVARFQREARLLASLSHPNIAAIHGLEVADGRHFLVMEFVPGETLTQRIRRGAIPLEDALGIARQITGALEAAHEKGIVHRDLKPDNVKVTPEGTVKVLDFGLAKAVAPEESDVTPSNSPTLTMAATRHGVILGTAAYMAPEQARGRHVDKRADIWAFGVVLYEMVTGKPLFQGEDLTEILAAVVKEQPDFGAAPAQLQRLLRKCLEKDRRNRLRDIGDVWELLEPAPATVVPASSKSSLYWSAIAALAGAVAVALWAPWRAPAIMPEPVRFRIDPPQGASIGNFAVSPDGRNVVMAISGADGRPRLWLRPLDSLELRELPNAEGGGTPPFWSPDSRFVVFSAPDQKLKKIDIRGGSPQTLCDDCPFVLGGSWNANGVILLAAPGPDWSLMQLAATGGQPKPLTDTTGRNLPGVFPGFLDERRFIYRGDDTIAIGTMDNNRWDSKPILEFPNTGGTSNVMYAPAARSGFGYLLFVRAGTLMAQRFDDRSLTLIGDASPLAEQVRFFWASQKTLTFLEEPVEGYQLTWVDLNGNTLGAVGEPGPYTRVRLSPDATRAVVTTRSGGGGSNLWLVDLLRGTTERLTSRFSSDPVWSPDGEWIAYFEATGYGPLERAIYRRAAKGAAGAELMFSSKEPRSVFPLSWSKHGFLLVRVFDAKNGNDIAVISLNDTTPESRRLTPLLTTAYNENGAVFSPDGRWIAYASDETGIPEIYVHSFQPDAPGEAPRVGRRFPVSSGGAGSLQWRADSKALFFMTAARDIMIVDWTDDPERPFGKPRLLRKARIGAPNGDMTTDGRSLVLAPVGRAGFPPLTVVVNWQSMLSN